MTKRLFSLAAMALLCAVAAVAQTNETITWDFHEYTDVVSLEDASTPPSVEYNGLTLVGNKTNNATPSDYVSSAGFHMNGKSSASIRYITYTPVSDGVLTVYVKANGSSDIRVAAIGTAVTVFSTSPSDEAAITTFVNENPTVLAAVRSNNSSVTNFSANLTANTQYYIYFANGGQTITKLEYTPTTSDMPAFVVVYDLKDSNAGSATVGTTGTTMNNNTSYTENTKIAIGSTADYAVITGHSQMSVAWPNQTMS